MERRLSVTDCGRYSVETFPDQRAVLRFSSGQGAVASALNDVTRFLATKGIAENLVEDATIALAEALNNIEEHAYAGQSGLPVMLTVVATDRCLRCEIEDRGVSLPGGSLPEGCVPKTDPVAHEKWPEGGFGWALLRRLTTELRYQRVDGWNRLCFTIS